MRLSTKMFIRLKLLLVVYNIHLKNRYLLVDIQKYFKRRFII